MRHFIMPKLFRLSFRGVRTNQSVVMNPLPNIDFPYTAPIPHQRAMKLHEDTWIYISEKFGNMEYIEDYKGILRYEKFV